MKKNALYIMLGIIVLLIITNPSRSSFMSYLHTTTSSGLGRDFNGLLFSVYSKNGTKYIGILENFIELPKPKSNKYNVQQMGKRGLPTLERLNTQLTPAPKISLPLVWTREEFAEHIVKKFPSYKNINDKDLVDKFLSKYPYYSPLVKN
ncbi:MAG: hypothetical protein ACOH2A_02125 [Sphingobacteriaceae bacterium]